MLFIILFWWLLVQLSAPTWCFVCLGVVIFFKCIDGILAIIKTIIDAYDNRR